MSFQLGEEFHIKSAEMLVYDRMISKHNMWSFNDESSLLWKESIQSHQIKHK